jgi:hypothetical protein
MTRNPWQSIVTILVAATLVVFLINQQEWSAAQWLTKAPSAGPPQVDSHDEMMIHVDDDDAAEANYSDDDGEYYAEDDEEGAFDDDYLEGVDDDYADDDDSDDDVEGGVDYVTDDNRDDDVKEGVDYVDDDGSDDDYYTEDANNEDKASDDDDSEGSSNAEDHGNDDDVVDEGANKDWPALSTIVDDQTGDLVKDAQFLVNFAIIAHPKCATSFTQTWLASHDEIEMHDHEIYAIRSGDPAELVLAMYELKTGPQYKRGFKSPKDVENVNALTVLAEYFPKTKLIIGLRHPVLWFESFYNFRLRQYGSMPPVDDLIGTLVDDMNGVSTDEARFHANLDNLRKTQRTKEELDLIGDPRQSSLPKSPNPVFLYEISQLYDEDETRKLQYVDDLKNYLGLTQDMKELADDSQEKHHNPPPGTIDICEHNKVRKILMKHATAASIWIREYFIASPDVTVSSPDRFKELVAAWMIDPCIARNQNRL